MVFGLNFYLSLMYASLLSYYCRTNCYGIKTALLYYLPIFSLWLIICGGQYAVGTDYGSYLSLFNGSTDLDRMTSKGEILFTSIVRICNLIGIRGQGVFYVFYSINILFLSLIAKRFRSSQLFLFILLYIVVTSLFNNQLNILRQTTACYIGTYAMLLLWEKKRGKSFVFVTMAFMIHNASLVYILAFLFNKLICRLNIRTLFLLLGVASVVGLLFKPSFLNFFIAYLPPDYAWFISGGFIDEQEGFLILLKYIYLPIYLLSLFYYSKHPEEYNSIKLLYNWGIVAFAMRLFLVNLTVVSRLFDFYLIVSIFPLLYYLSAISNRQKNLYYIIIFSLIFVYSAKVILFPRGEYAYHSIYFL